MAPIEYGCHMLHIPVSWGTYEIHIWCICQSCHSINSQYLVVYAICTAYRIDMYHICLCICGTYSSYVPHIIEHMYHISSVCSTYFSISFSQNQYVATHHILRMCPLIDHFYVHMYHQLHLALLIC